MTDRLSEMSWLNANSCFFTDFRLEYSQAIKMVISRFFIETMSQNNTIRKSDKKFIRTEKSRIRRQFSDSKKQEEMINELYKKFVKTESPKEVKAEKPEKEVKTEKGEAKKPKAIKKEKVKSKK